ncbi:MAG: DUF58 domain-containing protein [Capsulimonadales bacterium]|nr:DUF58 domain-containing protein [Capsulimonadales bacterium]
MNWAGGAAGIKSIVITLSFIFLFIVAVLLDLQYLYLMAVTLAVLPLASYMLAYFFTSRFTAERVHPTTVREGRRFDVELKLVAEGGLPQAAMRLGDETPRFLTPTDSDILARRRDMTARPLDVWDGTSGSLKYALVPEKRGVYRIGPAHLETTDPLGLFTFTADLPVLSEITVLPEPIPARDTVIGGEGTFGLRERDGKTRRGEGLEFHGVREYRPGDPLRRVHWRTTARTGRLAVVEYERAYQQDIVLVLDLAKGTEYGEGRNTTLEFAVKVAATLASRTLTAGGGVTLIAQTGTVVVKPREGDPDASRFRLFDFLARVRSDAETSIGDVLQAARPGDGSHFVVLTAQGDPTLIGVLGNRIQRGDEVTVYFFEPGSFGGPSVLSPAIAGAKLRVVTAQHSPWEDGGRNLEYLLREND